MGNDYFNVAEVVAACQRLQLDHSKHVQLVPLSEPSHEGRSATALRLCENTAINVRKPVFMVIGGLHGCEWGSSEIIINLAADLVQGRDSDLDYGGGVVYDKAKVQSVLQGLDLLLLPLVNPDGRYFSQTNGEFWRKNRSQMEANSGPGIGVDLNRNFDVLFAESVQPLASPFYAGPGPLSEPEARNVQALVKEWDPDWFVDLHAGARCVVHPFSVGQPPAPMPAGDLLAYQQLGGAYAAAAQNASGQPMKVSAGFQFISASGTSHDWVHGARQANAVQRNPAADRAQTLAFSVEWSSDMVPMWFDMQALIRESSAGLVAMCLAALAA